MVNYISQSFVDVNKCYDQKLLTEGGVYFSLQSQREIPVREEEAWQQVASVSS